MDKREQLRAVIDGIIKGDDTIAKDAFAPYVQAKTRELLGYVEPAEEITNEALVVKLKEFSELVPDSPVRFKGDKVLVAGKVVGVIQNDPTDWDSGINFIEEGGKFSKEFDNLETLYDFLIQRYARKVD